MFESLSTKLTGVFDRLRGRGALTEDDVNEAMREVRVALLEADVALPVVKDFIAKVKERAIGQEVIRSVTPGQQVVKIVHDNLVEVLGEKAEELAINVTPPAILMMLGLQGSGKTTTAAKLAKRLKEVDRKKVLLASLDVYRPAAQEQLAILAEQVGVASLPIRVNQKPVEIAQRALETARLEGYDVLILDTAGRLAIDEAMMAEAAAVRDVAAPHESLLVVDAMTGQDAVNTAKNFEEKVGVTGIILTRIDGDARGGAAISMRAITGRPIKFLGTGEKIDALEVYHPDRLAGRILDMGDVVSFVEKAAATMDQGVAEDMAKKFIAGKSFDFDDMAKQMQQVRKMGGIGGFMGMLPGMNKFKEQVASANVDEGMIKRQEAIISSMTKKERKNADLLNASRKRRIAAGSGVDVADVNRLIKQYMEMQKMMKQLQRLGKAGFMRSMAGMMGGRR
ncbi:MAG: signal recognition particle protein [Proteobacteria bacterium]|jgi:signal recognition particle subunit SRP54|nr:signal recognition particle protein [Alphaproteobacteria bacterium]MDX9690062.1 signal recognition particle protein [Alphaproteobacteria bacterium]NCC03509.1 signal recognition particle protein [Pseudomonadota bacterium]